MVRLIQVPFQEYLRVRREIFGKARSVMAKACSSYLNLRGANAFLVCPSSTLKSILYTNILLRIGELTQKGAC